MRRIRQLSDVTRADRGASAAIGNFDGVHLGHQWVLDQARQAAPDAPLAVLTFEPHPREVFRPGDPPFRLTNAEARAHRLEKLGVDILFELPFVPELFGLTDTEFCEQILRDGLGLRHVTVGADFRFGKGRVGNAESLQLAGSALGFGVTIAPLKTAQAGAQPMSSTAIRAALSEGRVRDAAAMLGHWHRIEAVVEHGAKRGRDLGYPTANMTIDRLHPPRFGVYAVLVDILTGPNAGSYTGVASLGVHPQFGDNVANLEPFIFDFDGDLYGQTLSCALIEFLRPEAKFDSLDALVAQIDQDAAQAREILAALPA